MTFREPRKKIGARRFLSRGDLSDTDSILLLRSPFFLQLPQLVIMTFTTIDAQSVNERALRVAVAPLLQTWFAVGELLATHRAGCTFAIVGCGLRPNRRFLAPSADVSRGVEMSCKGGAAGMSM